jgi:hypothetical protein
VNHGSEGFSVDGAAFGEVLERVAADDGVVQGKADPSAAVGRLRRACELRFDGLLVAHDANAKLIVLAWSHRSGVGRARVVSETVARAEVPVRLVSTA